MDTTNIILHWIAHFRGQVTNTETRPRPNARDRGWGRGINITVKNTDKSNHMCKSIA